MPEALSAALTGLGAGILSGLFGIGGALLTTPVLRLLLDTPGLVAVGTSLAVVVPTALMGAFAHHRRGSTDLRAGLAMGLVGAPLAVAGAWGASLAGATLVLLSVSAAVAYMAIRIWTKGPTRRDDAGSPPRPSLAALALVGAVAGAASGFMGLGGGFVMVPVLSTMLGYPIRRAVGTSLVAIVVLATPGALAHAALGHVDLMLALTLAVGMVPGALVGARLAHMGRSAWLRRAFAVGLGAMALALVAGEIGLLSRG